VEGLARRGLLKRGNQPGLGDDDELTGGVVGGETEHLRRGKHRVAQVDDLGPALGVDHDRCTGMRLAGGQHLLNRDVVVRGAPAVPQQHVDFGQ